MPRQYKYQKVEVDHRIGNSKKKGKPRSEDSLAKLSAKRSVNPDDPVVRRINQLHDTLWEYPPVDLDDVEEVNDRTVMFFRLCDELGVKALWESYCFALGYGTFYIRQMVNGEYKRGSNKVVRKAYDRLKADLAMLTAAGQINPVSAIFFQKNNYNYVDKVEITATHTDKYGEQKSIAEIEKRLLESVPQDDVIAEAQFFEIKEPEEIPKE